MSLNQRQRQPELMDDPALDAVVHQQALHALRRVNHFSRTAAVLERAIVQSCCTPEASADYPEETSAKAEPLRILDIASGGGDLAIQLATRLEKRSVRATVEGCDISATAIDFATQQARRANCAGVKFFKHDALADKLPAGHYDVVMCSLFMHHLDEADVVRLLQTMKQAATQLVMIDDLRRTRLGYWLAWLGCRLLTRSAIVHVDGPLSVQGAFTVAEATKMARQAEWHDVRVTTHWPERFLMSSQVLS